MTLEEIKDVLEQNHKHHQDYDDYGGYPESELADLNHAAILSLQQITEDKESLLEVHKETQALMNPEKRMIVSAACRWPDGHVIMGVRHFCPMMQLQMQKSGYNVRLSEGHIEQGFVDQWGIYLNRQEAYEIAKKNGQYKPYPPYTEGTLYSEDLY